MAKNRKRGRSGKTIAALGCLTVVAAVVVAGVIIAPRVGSMLMPAQPSWAGMPWYGPSQEYTVALGSVSEGASAYGLVSPERVAKLMFEHASGEVTASIVSVGMPIFQGQVLVELDGAALERDLARARADLQDAEEALAVLLGGGTGAAERLRLEVELAAAQQMVSEARAVLAADDAGGDAPADRLARAIQDLAAARAARDALLNDAARLEQIEYLQWIYNMGEVKHGEMVGILNPSEQDIDNTWLLRIDMLAKREALEQAQHQYEMEKRAAEQQVNVAARAVAALDAQIAQGIGDIERLKREAEVKKAEARVATAQESLAAIGSTVAGVKVTEAQAKVLKSEGALRDAEAARDDATLVAPFDGTITDGNVLTGQRVSAGMTLLTIEDSSSLRIMAQVNEIDIDRVREGNDVVLSFDAFPGEPPRRGRVGAIPMYGKYSSGVSIFSVPIGFDPEGITLFQGMSANIIFPSASRENVLVVPAAAAFADQDGDYVMLMVGGQPEKRYVTKGLSDGIFTEIVAGLAKGDVVSVPIMGPRGSGVPGYFGGTY